MPSVTSLNAGLFIGGEHKILGPQGLFLPDALIEIEDRASFFDEQRIARKKIAQSPFSKGKD